MASRASSTEAEEAIAVADREEQGREESEGLVVADLWRLRQKEKDEDQRGQDWDLGRCLGAKWGKGVHFRRRGWTERERMTRVAMSMLNIRREANRALFRTWSFKICLISVFLSLSFCAFEV